MDLTKQEARKILLSEAKYFKYLGLSSKEFVQSLENRNIKQNVNSPIIKSYILIKNELEHITAFIWGWDMV